jgi:hypothetical protein
VVRFINTNTLIILRYGEHFTIRECREEVVKEKDLEIDLQDLIKSAMVGKIVKIVA